MPRIALARPNRLPITSRAPSAPPGTGIVPWTNHSSRDIRTPGGGSGGGGEAVDEAAREQLLDVLGDHVGLEVDQVAGATGAQRGAGQGLGDEADGEAVVLRLDDGEADTVDGDRALVDEVAGEVGGQGDLDEVPVLAGRAGDDLADAVDVALHDVAAEALVDGDRALEVDPVTRCHSCERGLVERLLHEVGGPATVAELGDGEAAAVDRDRVAQPGALEHRAGLDGEPDGIALVGDLGDGAELLDDSGEHLLPPHFRRMVSRTLVSSPSWPCSTVTSETCRCRASAMVVIPRSATALVPAPSSIGAT